MKEVNPSDFCLFVCLFCYKVLLYNFCSFGFASYFPFSEFNNEEVGTEKLAKHQ